MGYFHYGDAGDIIYFLPALKFFHSKGLDTNFFIKPNEITRQYMTADKLKPLQRLIEAQGYVDSFGPWHEGVIAIDANTWRTTYNGNYNLCYAALDALNVPHDATQHAWLENIEPLKIAPVVVNRSFRYHGYFPVKEIDDEAIFIGLPNEHVAFQAEFNIKLPYYETKDFYHAAQVIAGSKKLVANNSACAAICEGLKHTSAIEIFPPNINIIWKRDNVKYYIGWTEKGAQMYEFKKENKAWVGEGEGENNVI